MQMRKIGFIMNINPLHPSKQVTTPVQCICGLDSLLSRTRRTISQHHHGGYLSTAVNNSPHIQDRRDLPPFLLSLAGQTLARIWTPTTYSPTLSCHTKSLLADFALRLQDRYAHPSINFGISLRLQFPAAGGRLPAKLSSQPIKLEV